MITVLRYLVSSLSPTVIIWICRSPPVCSETLHPAPPKKIAKQGFLEKYVVSQCLSYGFVSWVLLTKTQMKMSYCNVHCALMSSTTCYEQTIVWHRHRSICGRGMFSNSMCSCTRCLTSMFQLSSIDSCTTLITCSTWNACVGGNPRKMKWIISSLRPFKTIKICIWML